MIKLPIPAAMLLAMALIACGCAGSQPPPASTQPQESPAPAEVEQFRPAASGDLSLGILEMKPAASGFPIVILNLRNVGDDAVIVAYLPKSVTIHCGPYIQRGPAATYARRREILDAFQYMSFVPPAGGWAKSSGSAAPEMLLPTTLPPGHYDVWATFKLAEADGGTIESAHRTYAAPKQK